MTTAVLTAEQLRTFGRDGFVVIRSLVGESLLAQLDEEVDNLIARKPPPVDKVGFHHHFELIPTLPVADRALRDSGVLSIAGELVAPLTIDQAFED